MTWWLWMVLGAVLAAVEIATPGGFFVIFFAVAAFLVGALVRFGLADAMWFQWLLFSVIAIVALRLFRNPLLRRLGPTQGDADRDALTGETAIPSIDIPPGGHGRAEVRGTTWNARNVDTVTLAAGRRGRVVAVNGLVLDIRSE